jgi:phosphoribosyl 1,2-cyclic phosphodiesterase
MKVRFWGVRGSYPVPGPSTNRYGGNTACVQVLPKSGATIVIDAGTGIRKLGQELMKGPCGQGQGVVHLLISHTHWDHIQGLPFFAPLHRQGNHIKVYSLHRDDVHLRHVFKSATEDPYFPVPFDAVKADVEFLDLDVGTHLTIDGVQVDCTRLNHPSLAMAYRLTADGNAVVYHKFIPAPPDPSKGLKPEDAKLLEDMRNGVLDLCRGADLVIYDTHFTMEEYQSRPHWGHSAPEHAVDITIEAGAKALVLFHHAPEHSDEKMDAIVEKTRALAAGKINVLCAVEGKEIQVGTEGESK